MQKISDDILLTAVEGVNLRGRIFGDQFDGEATLLVFLRHFGWIFCRESVKDLRDIAARDASYPKVVFVYQGTVRDGEEFFDTFWKGARAIADLPRRFYRAFGLQRGTLVQIFGPAVVARGIQAAAKGNFVGKPVGDVLVLAGFFLIKERNIVWEYRARHAGDHPDFKSLSGHASASS